MIEKLGITSPPWEPVIGKYGWVVKGKDCAIAMMQKEQHVLKQTHERQDRDARLISAAPEMLEALIELQNHNDLYPQGWNVKDIIAKATGHSWAEVKELIQ